MLELGMDSALSRSFHLNTKRNLRAKIDLRGYSKNRFEGTLDYFLFFSEITNLCDMLLWWSNVMFILTPCSVCFCILHFWIPVCQNMFTILMLLFPLICLQIVEGWCHQKTLLWYVMKRITVFLFTLSVFCYICNHEVKIEHSAKYYASCFMQCNIGMSLLATHTCQH